MTDRAYDFFGVRKQGEDNGKYRYLFRLPCAHGYRVELIGDFNLSEPVALSEKELGIWEVLYESDIPLDGMKYTYKIFSYRGEEIVSDPFSLESDVGNNAASIIRFSETFDWKYEKPDFTSENAPLSALRIKLEDWNSKNRFNGEPCLNYRDLKNTLSNYLKEMYYTHIELADANGGHLFASSLYGSPDDFKFFVDEIHGTGKGVIVDFEFNKSYDPIFNDELYESFFVSEVMYWFRDFNIDGIKLNVNGLRTFVGEGLLRFLKRLTETVYREFPFAIVISDDVFGENLFPDDANRFFFKCNHGWRKDFLEYIKMPADKRFLFHSNLTFSLQYSFLDRFILPLNEDGVKSYQDLKLLLGAMIMHPGKKMIFERKDPLESDKILKYREELNRFYLNHPQLWELDSAEKGFQWVIKDNAEDCVIAYKRFSMSREELLCVFNFSLFDRPNYEIVGLETDFVYREVFNSDNIAFGGSGRLNNGQIKVGENGKIKIHLPPLTVVAFEKIKK